MILQDSSLISVHTCKMGSEHPSFLSSDSIAGQRPGDGLSGASKYKQHRHAHGTSKRRCSDGVWGEQYR